MASLGDELLKLAVWAKTTPAPYPHHDRNEWGLDAHGFLIRYSDHGNRDSPYGWEKDHYPVPAAMGGLEVVDNLRPLRCKENARLGGILGNLLTGNTPLGDPNQDLGNALMGKSGGLGGVSTGVSSAGGLGGIANALLRKQPR